MDWRSEPPPRPDTVEEVLEEEEEDLESTETVSAESQATFFGFEGDFLTGITDGAGALIADTTVTVPSLPFPDVTGTTGATAAVVQGTGASGTGAAVRGGGTIQLTCEVIDVGKVVTGGVTVEGTLPSAVIPAPKPGGTLSTRPSLEAVVTAPTGNGNPANPVGQAPATAEGTEPTGAHCNPPTFKNGGQP